MTTTMARIGLPRVQSPGRIMAFDKMKEVISTLSFWLTKTVIREHSGQVKPLTNGTGSSEKGADRPPYSVLVYGIRLVLLQKIMSEGTILNS